MMICNVHGNMGYVSFFSSVHRIKDYIYLSQSSQRLIFIDIYRKVRGIYMYESEFISCSDTSVIHLHLNICLRNRPKHPYVVMEEVSF